MDGWTPIQLQRLCQGMHEYLIKDDTNVAAVHCKGGKGRTGTAICCYLIEAGIFNSADTAREYFAKRRTDYAKGKAYQGVQTPSQARYIRYYAAMTHLPMLMSKVLSPPTFRVNSLRVRHLDIPAAIRARCSAPDGPMLLRLEIYDGMHCVQGSKGDKDDKEGGSSRWGSSRGGRSSGRHQPRS